ncbi:MAG: hypothetical protein ACI9KN_002027 [Gammaproteobacteria bacterium]|jgi:hypothetical protein
MMEAGDKVYYLHTNKFNTETKFAAIVIAIEAEGVLIRVGRLDIDLQEIKTFESVVSADSLLPRKAPCSFESDLLVHSSSR